jgi:DNA-binding transcriptional ArsR family regulator
MSTLNINPPGHQIKIADGYKVVQCKDCHGFFFILNDRKTKVEEAAPNHTWDRNNSSQLRHLTKEIRERRVNASIHPWPTTTIKIIEALTEKSNLNVTEITKKTGLSSRTINKALKKLTVNEAIKYQWYGKSKRFAVNIEKAREFLANEENLLYDRKPRVQSTL